MQHEGGNLFQLCNLEEPDFWKPSPSLVTVTICILILRTYILRLTAIKVILFFRDQDQNVVQMQKKQKMFPNHHLQMKGKMKMPKKLWSLCITMKLTNQIQITLLMSRWVGILLQQLCTNFNSIELILYVRIPSSN